MLLNRELSVVNMEQPKKQKTAFLPIDGSRLTTTLIWGITEPVHKMFGCYFFLQQAFDISN